MELDLEKNNKRMETDKELLLALPVNTKRNKKAFLEKAIQMKEEYEGVRNEILKEIKAIYEQKTNIKENENLQTLQKQLKEIENIENIVDDIRNSYEKMGLDRVVHSLKRFYKTNLNKINEELKECIELFKKLQIKLTYKDFNFTPYTLKYMKAFFEEMSNEKIDSKRLEQIFEQIYWESPNVIVHIQLNIRYIFLKKEKEIDSIFKWQNDRITQKLKMDKEAITERYNTIYRKYLEQTKAMEKRIINNFLDGYWNVKDYEEKNINKYYSKFVSQEKIDENKEEVDANLITLLHNLYEYESYIRYKFIFDDMKEIYDSEKDKEKYRVLKREIIEQCDKIFMKKNIFSFITLKGKNDDEDITKLIDLFEKLDQIEIKQKIKEILNPKSTIKDMGKLALSYYKYLFNCMIKYDKEITEEEIKVNIEEFEEFIKYPYDTISHSIIMGEEKDIPLMIKDRYNLFGIKLTKESLDVNNIRNLILDLEKIENYYYIRKMNIDLEEVKELCRAKKILNENS